MQEHSPIQQAKRKLKASVISTLILAACGAVSYNILFSQDASSIRPGKTAVRVQVKDIDIPSVLEEAPAPNSIGELARRAGKVSLPGQGSKKGQRASARLTTQVQAELSALGYYQGPVDGQPGAKTAAAIRLYQKQNGIAQNGAVSSGLLEHLRFTRKISEASSNTATTRTPAGAQQADPRVKKIQQRLILFGYNPGKPDGIAGRSTIEAIKQFQADRSMPVTGKLTRQVMTELGV